MARRLVLAATLVFVVTLVSAACDGWGRDARLVVGTEMPEELREYVEGRFEAEHPDVDVRFLDLENGYDPRDTEPWFDVGWGIDALSIRQAEVSGKVMQWQPFLTTPFVIAFNRDQVQLTRAPTDWVDIFHHRWAGELLVLDPARSSEGAYFAGSMIVEALRDDDDLNRGFDWLGRLDGQDPEYAASDAEALRALQLGDVLLAILPRAAVERARQGNAPWVHYRIPESGAPVLARGVAIMDGTEVLDAARRFYDFVLSTDVLTETMLQTRWEPGGDIERSRVPSDFMLEQRVTAYPLALDTLATELSGWLERWDLEVRGQAR